LSVRQLAVARLAILVFWRDLVMPGAGLYLILLDPGFAAMAAWQYPLVGALLGTPLVGRGASEPNARTEAAK
jgi:hypothetical protein